MTESTKSSDKQKSDKDALKLERQKCKVLKSALKEEKNQREQLESDMKLMLDKNEKLQVQMQEQVLLVLIVGGSLSCHLSRQNFTRGEKHGAESHHQRAAAETVEARRQSCKRRHCFWAWHFYIPSRNRQSQVGTDQGRSC